MTFLSADISGPDAIVIRSMEAERKESRLSVAQKHTLISIRYSLVLATSTLRY
jgi:hypothetical protein